jgi:hypothetical protein
MKGAIPPLLQYAFMAWCLVKHRDNFTFTTDWDNIQGSSVGVSLGYELDDRGLDFRRGLGISHFCVASRPVLRTTQPPID